MERTPHIENVYRVLCIICTTLKSYSGYFPHHCYSTIVYVYITNKMLTLNLCSLSDVRVFFFVFYFLPPILCLAMERWPELLISYLSVLTILIYLFSKLIGRYPDISTLMEKIFILIQSFGNILLLIFTLKLL